MLHRVYLDLRDDKRAEDVELERETTTQPTLVIRDTEVPR